MLYFRLKQRLPNERAALAAMQSFSNFGAHVKTQQIPKDDGSMNLRFAVLIPAGRRPTSITKQLEAQAPHSKWTLVDVDADGFESEVLPEAGV